MTHKRFVVRLLFGSMILAVILFGTLAFAGKKPPADGGSGCPKTFSCTDIWDPVQCADGVVYGNQCYADRACAPKPCQSVEGGPVEY